MEHYGKYLIWAGNSVKYESFNIEILLLRKERLKKELKNLNNLIKEKEKEFTDLISKDWTKEEINEAKEKVKK